MNLHEYQAKQLLAGHGVPVPKGVVVLAAADAEAAAAALDGPVWVVKAQIHAGGRGKAGGVKVVKSAADAVKAARDILGMTLVTPQTGPGGKEVHRVYIEQGVAIDRELYLSVLVDRASKRVNMMASTEGGMDIEEVAAKTPDKILRVVIDPAVGIMPFHARKLAFGLGLKGGQVRAGVKLMIAAYNAFIATDASLVEINPLVVSGDDVLAVDAKIVIDDNGLFRQQEIAALRDESEEDPSEILAQENSLNYIKLDGDIGCLVNGAGLAMATMDIIKFHGGDPANFLDVGGGAPKERVVEAFKIILRDPNVRGILVNIFAGINRCDVVAAGVVEAVKEVGITVPMVVRLEGTLVDEGRKILNDSGLAIIAATGLADAAEKIVAATREAA
ncbi:MAG: ADP-forming succinate--CoA ligase subunit beta [Proteobacteria bacterium]|nr:ADP-forming succinate--CoA ligase subunit beta [Pseudomonadota bacterium]MDA1132212.1 ADP-forming succinate--CoA ligase subunit beta [Pseudomonadota bacterium]